MKQRNKHPLVSVVMSCYNSGKYIKETIESVLSQTFRDFEFIIWDDGSTDKTKEIIESFHDDRIRYFYHENTGLGMALKLACAEAKGKYIARMDSDDICLPDRISIEADFLERHRDYVLVSSAIYYMDEKGNTIGRSFPCTDYRVLQGILMYSSMIVHPMVMMRRDSYEAAGGYIPLRGLEDRPFWSRIAKQGKLYNIPTPLGKYRLLGSSLGHSRNSYDKVLFEFRNKMMRDDVVLDSDIEMFNMIYQYSKKFKQFDSTNKECRGKSPEERIYLLLHSIFGHKTAEQIIVNCKNLYYRWKLHV